MGGSQATPPPPSPPPTRPPPPSPPEFVRPWRNMHWGSKDVIEQKLRNFRLYNAQFARILVVGEVGAGKSSFLNSVNNAFQGRITSMALVGGITGTSFTKVYKTHFIQGKDASPLPFVFNDIMGLESSESGAPVQDIIKALHGFLPEGYRFNPASPLSSNAPGYRSNPSLEDQTSCLVIIIAADKIPLMYDELFRKLNDIREAASHLNMPQVIIMTKVDVICPLVRHDIKKIYTSKKIKETMKMCSYRLGISMIHIFPVKNYHEEMDTDDDIDLLILKALEQIVHMVDDKLWHYGN